MKTRSSILMLLFMVMFACNGSSYNKNATIKGKLINSNNEIIILERLTSTEVIFMDSTKIDDKGMFSFAAKPETEGFYRVKISNQNFVNVVYEKGTSILLEGDAKQLAKNLTVQGSPETERMLAFNNELSKVYYKNDSLKKLGAAYQQSGNYQGLMALQQEQQKLGIQQQKYIQEFIEKKPGSFVSLAAVQSLKPDQNLDLFIKVEEGLKKTHPNSELTKTFSKSMAQMRQSAEDAKRLNIGSEAPEIMLSTPQGESLALSSLRGKVVLIDFWASWCRPCRAENPNVVKVYNKYKDKGFDILSVSLDNNKDRWLNAIKADGLEWNHVSDLKGWKSVVTPQYKVTGIPKTYLLDKNGIIIAKDLRGPALERKLAEVLGG